MRVAVIGAGSFGTAVANVVARNGVATHLWMRDVELLEAINKTRENRRYLEGVKLVDQVLPTTDLQKAAAGSDVIYFTVPSASFREVATDVAPHVAPGTYLVSATKGVEGAECRRMSEILAELMPLAKIGVMSGPNLAEEMAHGEFTGTVVASDHPSLCTTVQDQLKSPTFRCYSSDDVCGVELGGVLKNIYAIICGMANARNVGQNTVAMLITRGLAEMSRFAVAMGANPHTFLGLAGVGDLFVTCTSPLSRNYRLGTKIAAGASLEEAMEDLGKLAEGVNTVRVVRNLSRELGIAMPLVEALYGLLFEGASLHRSIASAMRREQEFVVEFVLPSEWEGQRWRTARHVGGGAPEGAVRGAREKMR